MISPFYYLKPVPSRPAPRNPTRENGRYLAADAGAVDILINNAGIYQFSSTPDTTPEMFDTHMAIDTRAPLLLVGALAPGMASRGHGAIVKISTMAATTPVRGAGVYGASKAALELLTRVWADEFGSQGVRVNAISAGPVRTPGTAVMGEDKLQALGRTTILGRVAEPAEIAEAVIFLASPTRRLHHRRHPRGPRRATRA
jgi:NAD(P)-dependent dehydrogenase (short-subunit alcohol dehydrogenase family)